MWICSSLGFFSIVEKQPGEFHVRARVLRDLKNLIAALPGEANRPKIITRKISDYRYRIVVEMPLLFDIFAALRRSIDYSNFKARIASDPHQDHKVPKYSAFWAAMAGFQP